jgi:hypothetical protein
MESYELVMVRWYRDVSDREDFPKELIGLIDEYLKWKVFFDSFDENVIESQVSFKEQTQLITLEPTNSEFKQSTLLLNTSKITPTNNSFTLTVTEQPYMLSVGIISNLNTIKKELWFKPSLLENNQSRNTLHFAYCYLNYGILVVTTPSQGTFEVSDEWSTPSFTSDGDTVTAKLNFEQRKLVFSLEDKRRQKQVVFEEIEFKEVSGYHWALAIHQGKRRRRLSQLKIQQN